LTYTGFIPGRDEDVTGLAIASIHNNDKYAELKSQENFYVEHYENILELTYRIHLNNWFTIQPDLQYVYSPANCQCNSYSFVYGTRLELNL